MFVSRHSMPESEKFRGLAFREISKRPQILAIRSFSGICYLLNTFFLKSLVSTTLSWGPIPQTESNTTVFQTRVSDVDTQKNQPRTPPRTTLQFGVFFDSTKKFMCACTWVTLCLRVYVFTCLRVYVFTCLRFCLRVYVFT